MRVTRPLLGAVVLLANIAVAHAGDIKCRDVVSLAEVDYPPEVAVTYTSSTNPERFCRFSINGYVADGNAAPELKSTMSTLSKEYTFLAFAGKLTGEFVVKALPYLLFAADNTIDTKLLTQTSTALDKNRQRFVNCYDRFFSKEQPEAVTATLEGVRLQCSAEKESNQIGTVLTVESSPIARATYISR